MTWLRDNNTNLHRERKANEVSDLHDNIAAITANQREQVTSFEVWLDDVKEFKKLSPQAVSALTDYVSALHAELVDIKCELLRSNSK